MSTISPCGGLCCLFFGSHGESMSLVQPPAHISLCSKGTELERGHLVAPGPWYLRKKKKKKSKEHELDKYDQLLGTCLKPPAAVVDIRKLQSLGDARKFYCLAPTRSTRLLFQLPGATRRFSWAARLPRRKQDISSHLPDPRAGGRLPAASPKASEELFCGNQCQHDIFTD